MAYNSRLGQILFHIWSNSLNLLRLGGTHKNKYQCGLRFDFGCTERRGRPQESKGALLMLIIRMRLTHEEIFRRALINFMCMCVVPGLGRPLLSNFNLEDRSGST
jgi:hypothetical protein